MKSADVCSRAGPVRHMVLPLRVYFPQNFQILLALAFCAGFTLSPSTSAAASTTVPTAQSSQDVIYFIEVTVDVKGPRKDQKDVIDWLQPVFQNNLQTCGPPVMTTSAPTTSTSTSATSTTAPTTSVTTSYTTTNVQTTTTAITSTSSTTVASTATTSSPFTTQSTTESTAASTTSAVTTLTTITTSTAPSATTSVVTTPTTVTASTAPPATTSAVTTPTTITASTAPPTTTSKPTTASESTSTNTATTQSPSTTASRKDETTPERTTYITSSPAATATARPPQNDKTTREKPNNGNNKPERDRRFVREISAKATGIFKDFEVSCVDETSIRKTTCYVTLTLKETVNPCCILQTLCAASKSSTSITVTGTRAERTNSLLPTAPQCNNPLEDVCVYNGPTGPTCVESGPDYSSNSTQCENKCDCSTYCSKTDAYYIVNITRENLEMTESQITSLLSDIKSCSFCPSNIASKYKGSSIDCTKGLPLDCTVIVVFTEEIPICTLSNLVVTLLKAQNINMKGPLTRAAICGNTVGDSGLLQSPHKLTDANLTPDQFCTDTEETKRFNCQPQEIVIAMLDERCVLTTTTATPNMTTSLQPTTTLSANETMNTTAAMNATSTPVNETVAPTAEDLAMANALLEMTKDASQLTSSQVDQLVSTLENLLSGPTVSLALGNISVNIVSNLQSASLEAVDNSKNRIMGIVETVSAKLVLTNTRVRTSFRATESILTETVAVAVQQANGTSFEETHFTIQDANNVQFGVPRVRRAVREASSVPQGSIRLPPTFTQNLTAVQQQMVSRVQFSFYQKSTLFQDKAMGARILNSGIIGASATNVTISNLKDNVIIYLRHIQPVPANYVSICMFWDFTFNNGSGGWNPEGCHVQESTDNETVCSCNHLTSFGILLDLSRGTITSRTQAIILTFITYIGCGISAIFLAVTLLTYLAFGKLRKDIPSKILIHLCMALLLLNLVFLVDAWLALYPDAVGLCISTAWFLHYFLLVAFTWMGLEAVHMYIALVKVFNSYVSHYMLKFSLAGWGIPMIVVIIVIAIDKDNYGLVSYGKFSDGTTDEFCWIKNDVAFYVAVVAYFCAIFLFNIVMFIVVLAQLRRLKKQNPHNVQHRTTFQDVRSVLGITILLGLTWGFAFFAWGPLNLPFMYLFAIFNSLQGFFIFVFHCAVKDNVRRQWRTYLCCGQMRLAENSEWSRTATQKTAKKSSVTRITSLHSSKSNHSSSSSSYLVSDSSDQMSGIGSPFSDRIITADEDPRMDVILNELNSQYRRL